MADPDFRFEASELDPDALRVLRFTGYEDISRPFRFEIELVSPDGAIDFDAVVGKPAFLWLRGEAEDRWVHGIVTRFEQTAAGRTLHRYQARLEPMLWTLGLTRRSRIYQDQSIEAIVASVLEGSGIPADACEWKLERTTVARKYCVQYRESDLEFLSRLLEEEGIAYVFVHEESGVTLRFVDAPGGWPELPVDEPLRYDASDSGLIGGERVSRFEVGARVRPSAVVLREYDPRKPELDLEVEHEADGEPAGGIEDYPGEYPDASIGRDLVRIRLEEQSGERVRARGASDVRALTAGALFELEGHPRAEHDGRYVVAEVRHRGEQPSAAEEDLIEGGERDTYSNTLGAFPADVAWRPARLVRKPIVEGPQTAVVTGPSGEEIHTDEYGRVKVRFRWDRSGVEDDRSSCWIRVGQGFGGAAFGHVFVPRVGQEVVVEFIEGDPDRPLVTGRLYNGLQPTPYELPFEKTKTVLRSQSSPGGGGANEIRLEDAAGSEEVHLHAQKDHAIQVGNDRALEVTSNHSMSVGGNSTLDVKKNETTHVRGSRTTSVDQGQTVDIRGTQTVDVTGSRSTDADVLELLRITGKHEQEVGATSGRGVGAVELRILRDEDKLETQEDYVLTVGGLVFAKIKGKVEIEVKGARSQLVGGLNLAKIKGDHEAKVKETWGVIAPQVKLKIKGELTIEGKDGIALIAGDAKIVMGTSAIEMTGSKHDFKASGTLKTGGGVIGKN